MNINRHWKRLMAVGCTHGVYACAEAQRNVLAFRESYKPHAVIDLGDVWDWAAFRSGAKGTKDEAANIAMDCHAGAEWLRRYRPTHRTNGNHDDRIYKLADHPSAIIAHAASAVGEAVRQVDEKNKTLVRPYHQKNGWWQFGDCKFGHGWMYNEMATRDHAETFGKCVHAHTHTPCTAVGRTFPQAQAWSVGLMADPERLTYAHVRRAWLRWAHGMVFGEYSDNFCAIQLVTCQCENGKKENWPIR